MRFHSLGFALILATSVGAATTACATTTIEHVWHAPDWTGSFTHVAIFAMTNRPGIRRDFETQMVAALGDVGVAATPSYRLFPDEGELRDEDIARVLDEHDIDGVLVTRLVGIDHEHRYVSGTPYAVVGGPRLGFYPFYHEWYGVLYSPGYTVEFDIVTLETNLYDASSSELVWSGLSETFDPKNVDETIDSYAQTMVGTLLDSGLIARTITPGAIESRD